MEHRRHPPGEVLRAPDAAQARLRVRVEKRTVSVAVPRDERIREHVDVADREIEPLRAGRRHDVRSVAGEVEAPPLHRLDDEAPHRRDALLEDRPLVERPAVGAEARLQLGPDPLVRPRVEVLVGGALEVQARQLGRAHAEQREPLLGVRVDQLVVRRRDRREDPQPAVRVLARVLAEDACRDARARDAVKPVAARRRRRTRARARLPRARSGCAAGRRRGRGARRRTTSKWSGRPFSIRAAMRSLTTSVCP